MMNPKSKKVIAEAKANADEVQTISALSELVMSNGEKATGLFKIMAEGWLSEHGWYSYTKAVDKTKVFVEVV